MVYQVYGESNLRFLEMAEEETAIIFSTLAGGIDSSSHIVVLL
jgi:hypothetical protein